MGVSKALHEILTINDRSTNIFVQQSPFLSVGSTTTYDGVQGMLPGASAASVAAEIPTESAEAWTEDAAVAQEPEQEEEEVAQPAGEITGYDGSSFGSAL